MSQVKDKEKKKNPNYKLFLEQKKEILQSKPQNLEKWSLEDIREVNRKMGNIMLKNDSPFDTWLKQEYHHLQKYKIAAFEEKQRNRESRSSAAYEYKP